MNALGLMLFALWVGLLAGGSGSMLERGLMSLRLPGRWVWLLTMAISVWMPVSALVFSLGDRHTAAPATEVSIVAPGDPLPSRPADLQTGPDVTELMFGWWMDSEQKLLSKAGFLPVMDFSRTQVAAAWGGASALIALILCTSLLRLHRRAKSWPEENLLGRQVKVSPDTGPATLGLLTPQIVVPRWARSLPESDLELILRHEGEHVRSRDTLLLGAGLAVLIACPWNPVLWWQMRRLRAAVEVDCDRRVLRDGVGLATYGTLLLTIGTRGRFHSLAMPKISGSASLLERRLTVMNGMQRRTSVPAVLATVCLALLLLAAACASDPPIPTESRTATLIEEAVEKPDESAVTGEDLIAIWINSDGTVQVNGANQPLDRVSEAIAPFIRDGLIAAIQADEAAPYRVVSKVQEELRAAGLLRVVFISIEEDGRPSILPEASAAVQQGLAVVLPDTSMPDLRGIESAQRNLLILEVRPSGAVGARRPMSLWIDLMKRDEVEEAVRKSISVNPNVIVLLETHPETEFRHMYEVLGGIQRANATRFSLGMSAMEPCPETFRNGRTMEVCPETSVPR